MTVRRDTRREDNVRVEPEDISAEDFDVFSFKGD